MTKALVSIIVPVYNSEKYLPECLECLINQTYSNIEIICINDGSTDNSLGILHKYALTDSRIKIYDKKNEGVSISRNIGIQYSQGDYITFIDADDTCSLNSIETSVNIAISNQSDIVINFLNVRYNQEKQPIDAISYLSTWQLFVSKQFLDKYPTIKFNPSLKMGEDAVFSHKLLALTDKISKNVFSKYFYRRSDNQTSFRYERSKKQEYLDQINLWLYDITEFYNENNLWTQCSRHFLNFIIEQPFTQYLRIDWERSQKNSLFYIIHNIHNIHNIKIKFPVSLRATMFCIFIKCKNPIQFELFRLVSKIYIRFINYKKQKGKLK